MTDFQIPWHPPARTLRQFAAIWLVVVGILAYRAGVEQGSLLGWGFAALALTCGLAGLIRPASIRPLFLAMTLITLPIGWVVSNALLVLTYFIVFAPFAIFFRLIGRDPLQRRFEPSRESYWEAKVVPSDPARYLRTF